MPAIPTTPIYRGNDRLVVNTSDAPRWIADGWSDKPPVVASGLGAVERERERKHRTARSGEPDPPILHPDD